MALVAQIDIRQGLENAWESVITFVPKLVGFLLILLIGILIAKGIEKLLKALLGRVGFDRLVERGGIKEALARSRFDASGILAKIVYWGLVLLTLQLAFGIFGPNPVSELLAGLIAFLPKLFVALLIVVIAAAIASAVKTILETALSGLGYGRTLSLIAAGAIWVVGIAAALNQIEVAPEIVNGLFYALLALVVGTGIVAIGGGGIQPMQQRWRKALSRLEQEAPKVRQEAQAARDIARQRAEELAQEAQTEREGGA